MVGVQLYDGLIKATEQIVAKFGKDVLSEERFVNILQDLYPNRDNPAVFRIIKTMINDGITLETKSTNKVNIGSVVAKSGLSLSQKYGYDESLVKGIIYSLAIGCGSITYSDYNALYAPQKQNQPKQKQQQKAPNKKQNKPAPSKQPQKNQQQPTRHGITTKYVFLLLFGFIVLFFSPAIYLGLTHNADWWPFFAIIPIAFLHFLSILMVGCEISEDHKNRPMPLVGGLYIGLTICTILFWIFCLIVLVGVFNNNSNNILSYYGFRWRAEEPTVISFFLSLFCAFCCSVFIPGAIEFSGIKIPANSNFSDRCKILFENKSFRKGFLFTCFFFLMVGVIGLIMPSFGVMWQNYKIERFNEKVESINAKNNQISKKRSVTYQNLSFGVFKLGSSLDSCVTIAKSTSDYRVLKETETPHYVRDFKISIADVDYSSIIDTTLYVSTIWDNVLTNVSLSFFEKKLVGISFVTDIDGDSLISMYSKKYGEPEYKLVKKDKTSYYYDNIDEYLENQLIPREYYWTFLNGIIKIYVSRDSRKQSMAGISLDYDGNIVTYFDRRCENVFQKLNAEKKRKEVIQERRIQDSLKHLEMEKQKQLENERMRKEKNHQESIEKI